MIDWATVRVPVDQPVAWGGAHLELDADGVVRREWFKPARVEGSYSSSVSVRPDTELLESGLVPTAVISGNPAKFLQGHNCWGSDSPDLIVDWVRDVLGRVGVSSPCNGVPWLLSRIDTTRMFELGSEAEVLRWLNAAGHSARSRHKRGSVPQGDTLYLGRESRLWLCRMYPKGREFRAHLPKMGQLAGWEEDMAAWAANKLRVEFTIRGKQLRRQKLDDLAVWTEATNSDLWEQYWHMVDLNEMVIDPVAKAGLPLRLAGALELWQQGEDIRSRFPRATFFRYRRELLDAGMPDIAQPVPKGLKRDKPAVQLREVLVAVPAQLPGWAASWPELTWQRKAG